MSLNMQSQKWTLDVLENQSQAIIYDLIDIMEI
jgi:hypothetical protein